jgi:hypothetical protein
MEDYGEKFVSWQFPEFQRHERGATWYIIFFVIAALLVTYCLLTANFLFLVIILICGSLVLFTNRHQPSQMTCTIWEDGITINDKLYAYDNTESFWIIYRPPEIKYLYFRLKSVLRPDLVIPLEKADPVSIRQTLLRFVPEDTKKEDESVAEAMTRTYKI